MFFHKAQEKPRLYGSFQDRQYSIWRNLEDIYRCDHESEVLIMPLFWGLPPQDYSGKNNHGTNHGAIYKDGSLAFDGNDWVDVGTRARPVETITVSALIKANTLTSHDAVVGDTDLISLVAGWQLEYYNGELHFFINSWNAHYAKKAFADTSSCHFVVGTYDKNAGSNQINIYIDNVLGTPDTYDLDINYHIGTYVADGVFIGKGFNDGSNSWDGLIDEVRISKAIRTADQIALFHDRPWDLYRRVARVFWSIPAAPPSAFIPQIIIF